MSIYILLYLLISVLLFFIWFKFIYKAKLTISIIYFSISILLFLIWLVFYLLSFTTNYNEFNILIYSKILYSISIPAMYSMLFFVLNFNSKKTIKYRDIIILSIFFILIWISIFTPFVISSLDFIQDLNIYKENFWFLYPIYFFLYISFLPIFLFFSYFKFKNVNYINKLRLKYLIIWFTCFLVLETLVLAIFPMFWIWILQKEQILFFIPFILSVFYVSHRYNFINIKFFTWKILNFCLSLILSYFLLFIFKYYLLNYSSSTVISFWWLSESFWLTDLFFWVILYIIFYNIFKKYVFGNKEYFAFIKEIQKAKKKISFLSNLNNLNNFLNKEFASIINTKYAFITLCSSKNLEWLEKYFLKNKSYNLFINDTVFIEENKHKFDSSKILEEISKKSYLVFPLFSNNEFIGIFEIGTKKFKDIYSSEEIALFYDFVDSLIIQLKHIDIYSEIQDANINLDRKVDEKTMEFNSLLNKQTDFISLISHEIRSPLWSCIFQSDSIIDDIKWWNLDKDYLIKELEILNTQLLSVWDLTKTLFSIKKFDLNKIELFKSKIDIHIFLSEKLNKYKRENKLIDFIIDVDSEISFIFIDKIQFWQVIDNLIVNAIKFANKENPQIYIKIYTENDNLIFEIEDNWKWFYWLDSVDIFDKYVTWNLTNVWIGMWMYLCKKIVELHWWSIKAWDGQYLNWAHFQIIMPK